MRPTRVIFLPVLVLVPAAVGCATQPQADAADVARSSTAPAAAPASAPPAQCVPLETRPPNGEGQQPASPGQTRTCGLRSDVRFTVEVVARGLEKPWSVEPLPDGALLVSEKPGRMRVVSAAGEVGAPIAGVPEVDARGQGGLLDLALSPRFATDRTVFWSFTEPREGGNGTSVARGALSP